MRLAAKAVAAGGLLLLALAVGQAGPAVAASASPCAHADALLQAGDFTSAYAAYAAVSPAGASCAKQGMAAAGALQAASQLITVGLVPSADAEIVKAVDADPTLTLPASLLTKTAATRAVALAKTLNADGFHQQAVQILLFVTETHGGTPLDPAARAILASSGGSASEPAGASTSGSAMSSVIHGIESYGLWEGFVLLIVLVLVVRTYYPLTRRRLHLQPFTLAGAEAGADAEHLRTQVREELQRLAVEHARTDKGRRLRIDVAGPYDEPRDIGSVVDHAPDQLKFIGALIGLLIKRHPGLCRPRLVTGALGANVEVRMGIATVDKTERSHMIIRHEDLGFPPVSSSAVSPVATRYAQLALPAAAWVIFSRYRKYTLGGTRNWDSFTKFAVGYEWQQRGRTDMAEEYYLRARNADRKHSTAAAVNLARLWQQREVLAGSGPVTGDHDWRDLLSQVATKSKTGDLQWYRSRYLLSLGLADQGAAGRGTLDEEQLQRARDLAVELAIEVMERLRRPDTDVPREFLENSQGPALALAVSQMIPTTENVDEVITMGFVPDDVTDDEVLWELKKARDGGSVAPEVIVPYIEACPPDSETDLHLYRYELNRWQACENAIRVIEEELQETNGQAPEETAPFVADPSGEWRADTDAEVRRALRRPEAGLRRQPGSAADREAALRDRLRAAAGAARDAEVAVSRYAERVSRSADPVLHARLDLPAQSERRDDSPDARLGNFPRWDRAVAPESYDDDYYDDGYYDDPGTDDQLPYTPG